MISQGEQQDPVNRYLSLQGYAMQPAFFYQTGYRTGWQINAKTFSMTYRLDGDVLLICDVQALHTPQGLDSALTPLIKLWRELHDKVAEVRQIRGIIQPKGTAHQQALRQKMTELLLSQGARRQEIDQQLWLIYPG